MLSLIEFKEIQDDQNYKHIGLFNRSGDPLVRFNSTNKSPKDRLEMIEKRLSSPTLIDDYYIIKAKNNTQNDTVTDDYVIIKDKKKMNVNNGQNTDLLLSQNKIENKIYSFKEGLDLNSKLIRLELDNKHLEIKIKELEELNNELEIELKEVELLSEQQETPIQDFLQETLKTAVPIFDKFIELRERKLAMQEQQNANYQTQQPQEPKNDFNNLNQEGADILDEKIKQFILVQPEKEQEYLKQCYNSSNSLDGFFNMVENYDVELFNDLKNSFN